MPCLICNKDSIFNIKATKFTQKKSLRYSSCNIMKLWQCCCLTLLLSPLYFTAKQIRIVVCHGGKLSMSLGKLYITWLPKTQLLTAKVLCSTHKLLVVLRSTIEATSSRTFPSSTIVILAKLWSVTLLHSICQHPFWHGICYRFSAEDQHKLVYFT